MAKRKTGRKTAEKRKTAQAAAQTQLLSVIWFAVAVLLLFIVFIKGENFWTKIHNFIFGIFGVTAFFYPFLLGFVAVISAMDKMASSIKAKIIEANIIVVLIGSCVDIFSAHTADTFWQHLSAAYTAGISLKSGGFLGALVGQPIFLAFGKTGAAITVILLIFVLVMILTGTTLITFFSTVARPVKSIHKQAETAYGERLAKEDNGLKVVKGFNVDIPVDDSLEQQKKNKVKMTSKQKRVVDTYYGKEVPVEKENYGISYPEGSEDKVQLDTALKTAEQEAEVIDLKAETESFTQDVEEGLETATDKGYLFPPLSLLKEPKNAGGVKGEDNAVTAEHLVSTLRSFGVETRIVDICRGPTVTRYELQPCAGVKISKITALADDIALNLAAGNVRIEAPIPNKAAVGIEVPNKEKNAVCIREILESPEFVSAKSKLTVALGKDISGNIITADISKMPHGLIAGATGSGKSVCTNSIIISLLYKNTPEELKLLLIDPKTVEFEPYNGIPHLLVPVVTDPRKAAGALGWAVTEMEKRYKMLSDRKVRNIEEYNEFVENLGDPEIEKMPYIVIMIDEFADLMQTASKEVEDHIARIAAKARAAGIHLLLATQRPSVDVITGVIKANIPTRIALTTSSQIDSRTIIDAAGAEKLLGRGDMLFSPVGTNKPKRVQGCFVSNEEIKEVVDFVKGDRSADYDDDIMFEIERQAAVEKKQKTGLPEDGPADDPMIKDAIKVVVENGMASTSLLQRKLKLGYARAARIIDEMEERGVVGPYEGSKPRKVLITQDQLMEMELSSDEE